MSIYYGDFLVIKDAIATKQFAYEAAIKIANDKSANNRGRQFVCSWNKPLLGDRLLIAPRKTP